MDSRSTIVPTLSAYAPLQNNAFNCKSKSSAQSGHLFTFTAAILAIEQYLIHPLTLFKPELHSFHREPSWTSVSWVLWQLFWILQTRSASASSETVKLLKSLAALTARVEGSDPPRLSVFFSSVTDFLHFFSRTRISRPCIQIQKNGPTKHARQNTRLARKFIICSYSKLLWRLPLSFVWFDQ